MLELVEFKKDSTFAAPSNTTVPALKLVEFKKDITLFSHNANNNRDVLELIEKNNAFSEFRKCTNRHIFCVKSLQAVL